SCASTSRGFHTNSASHKSAAQVSTVAKTRTSSQTKRIGRLVIVVVHSQRRGRIVVGNVTPQGWGRAREAPELEPEVIPPNRRGAIRLDVAKCPHVPDMLQYRLAFLRSE